ncbi:unnamed protein product [Dracunculus medinensis]|uniref:UBX domain-containing protein n=1 Tax=Dracunculus medinensis TaxID=318479 RepID=A0A0N4UCI2_DRAME|nr:unnamed protein product [Dracunculus medinensis]
MTSFEQVSRNMAKSMEICFVDDDTATNFLLHNDWNLESAVQHFFHGEGNLDSEENQNITNNDQELRRRVFSSNGPTVSSSSSQSDFSTTSVRLPLRKISPRPLSWFEWVAKFISLPLTFAYHTLFDIIMFVYSLFRARPLAVADPRGDVFKFISDFKECYGEAATAINFHASSYNEALAECKKSLRFMLVYLHNASHQSSERFVREILLNDRMNHFIQRNQILLWGASVQSQEGYKVSMALRENTYPFLGLLCMRDNRMVIVLRLEGDYELEPMLYVLQLAIDENRVYLEAIRNERNQREADMRIRREQEMDYERCLAEDRAKLNEKRRVENEKLLAEKLEAEQKLLEERKKQQFESKRAEIIRNLPQQPENSGSIRVSVRFPCGDRFERKFNLDDSIELLFNATLAHEKCPSNFSLLSSYPRRQLNCAPEWYREYGTVHDPSNIPTFRECGFDTSIMVLVQNNDA